MKKNIFLLFFIIMTTFAYGIENPYPVKTSVDGGRFEIIQSPVARRVTIMLDKETGTTYQLVKSENNKDDYTWQKMFCLGLLSDEGRIEGKVNYQIFLGAYSLKDCYLINIHTGKTWQLGEDKDLGLAWVEME